MKLPAALGFLLAVFLIAPSGCGEGSTERSKDESPKGATVDLPRDVVAMVGRHRITERELDGWLEVTAKDQMRGEIPKYLHKCVTWIGNKFALPGEEEQPFVDELPEAECRSRFERLKQTLAPNGLELLIRAVWVDREARAKGVTATVAEARRGWQKKLKEAFKDPRSRRDYVGALSRLEVRLGLVDPRLAILLKKLLALRREAQRPLGEQAIKGYFRENRYRYRIPEVRTGRVILASRKSQAEKAMQELREGRGFKAVARELPGITPEGCCSLWVQDTQASESKDGPPTLANAALAAPKGRLMGPIKTIAGWYVFKVLDIAPEGVESLVEHRNEIARILGKQRENALQPRFIKYMHERYRPITTCAQDIRIPMCSNGPKPRFRPLATSR